MDGSPAVFLDKDGTLIPNIPFNVDPHMITLETGVLEGLSLLHGAGYKLIVISNQPGVAFEYFKEGELMAVRRRLEELFQAASVPLTDFYYCPHHPEGSAADYSICCSCRKPKPGLIYQAAQDHEIDLKNSWFIGDILNDVEAGRRAGCQSILINNGNETEWKLAENRIPHYMAQNLYEAACQVLAGQREVYEIAVG